MRQPPAGQLLGMRSAARCSEPDPDSATSPSATGLEEAEAPFFSRGVGSCSGHAASMRATQLAELLSATWSETALYAGHHLGYDLISCAARIDLDPACAVAVFLQQSLLG